jgi:hypothetical protein
MRRPAWLRALAAVWAIWLQAALLAPASFDHCPEHGSHAAQMHAADHLGHAAHASHEHGAPAGQHGNHGCTCLGACCCAAPVASPAGRIDVPTVATVDAAAPIGDRDARVAVVLRPHSLPFANGPPTSQA